MAIVRMKKLTLAAPKAVSRSLISELMRLGCVEIDRPNLDDPSIAPFIESKVLQRDVSDNETLAIRLSELEAAKKLLDKYAPEKKPMLSPKRQVHEFALFDSELTDSAVAAAGEINAIYGKIRDIEGEISALNDRIEALIPWEDLDLPLDYVGGRDFEVILGGCPLFVKTEALVPLLPSKAVLWEVKEDKTRRYLAAVVHREDSDELVALLRKNSFTRDGFDGVSGTARENLTALRAELKQKQADKLTAEGELAAYGQKRALIEQSCDAVINEMSRQDTRNLMLMTDNVVFFSGWLPAELVKPVETLCNRLGAACEFEDPTDEDDVPVSLHSGKLTDNFNSVTSMYGMPAYNSFIDPTPTMAFFYIMAFGVMLSDAAYGLLLALGCAIYLKRVKPQGGMKSTMTMFLLCGISTFLWGMLLGGFFGNSVEVISGNFFGHKIVQPAWINPIDQPIQMMVLSYVFGAVQIFAAMFLDSLRRIKRKDWLGAIFGIYAWYLLFIGLGLLLLKPSIGIYVAIAGAVGVMIGGSLGKKGFGKITGGLMALYDITGFLSDILSYSRLLALCLSTAVVSNVINTMGSLFGGGIGGAIAFSLVFIIGHVFNLALNLLGSYVHTSRLQYIEYFGRFYEGGGRTFEPLQIKTKYVNIIQEVN